MSRTDRNQYLLSAAALGMSVIAMFFAFLELRSSDRQYEATVWPYVDIDFGFNINEFGLTVSNKGLGPALIHEFRLIHDGEELAHPIELMALAGRDLGDITFSASSVPDTVLAVGEELVAFRVEGENVGRSVRSVLLGLDVRICYCSINGACWNNYQDGGFRQQVEQCEAQTVDVQQTLDFFDRIDPPDGADTDQSDTTEDQP